MNLNQIELISQKLNDEKSKFMTELSKVNILIAQRRNSFNKMNSYLSEYLDDGNLPLTKSTPGLNKNIHLFVSKINDVMSQSESEIEILSSSRDRIVGKITELDKKIDLLTTLKTNINLEKSKKEEKKHQAMIDDLIPIQLLRNYHE